VNESQVERPHNFDHITEYYDSSTKPFFSQCFVVILCSIEAPKAANNCRQLIVDDTSQESCQTDVNNFQPAFPQQKSVFREIIQITADELGDLVAMSNNILGPTLDPPNNQHQIYTNKTIRRPCN